MKKIDKAFVLNNNLLLAVECLRNAKELKQESQNLRARGAFARAYFLAYTGLEESAKAILLVQSNLNLIKINALVDHKMKIAEIIKIIEIYLQITFPLKDKSIMGERIMQMREDSLYTRLKPTPKEKYCPDNEYWQKRAKSFISYLDKYLSDLTKKMQKVLNEYKV